MNHIESYHQPWPGTSWDCSGQPSLACAGSLLVLESSPQWGSWAWEIYIDLPSNLWHFMIYIYVYIYVYCHFIGKLNQWIYLDLRDRIWSDMIFLRLTGACLWDTCSTGSSLACQWKPQLGTWGVSANDNMLPIATLNTLLSFVKWRVAKAPQLLGE